MTFNQPVTRGSVEEHLYFCKQKSEGSRFSIMAEPDPADDDPGLISGVNARRIWLVYPHEALPPDTGFSLHIEPGLASALGPERGVTNRDVVHFDTFPEFRFLGIRCRTNNNKEVFITPEKTQGPEIRCNPLDKVYLVVTPTVIGNVDGALRYMRDYPYGCWEQKLSKGVMAYHYTNMRNYLPEECLWDGADLLPQKVLSEAADFQAPNGGMAYFVPKDTHVCLYLSAYTALAFNWLRKGGAGFPRW